MLEERIGAYAKLLGIYLRGILSHFIIVRLWPTKHLDKAMLLWCWAWEYAEWEAICQFEGERLKARKADNVLD